MRFMDAKTKSEKPLTRVGRWWLSARTTASRVFTLTRRSPFDDSLKLGLFLMPGVGIKHDGSARDSVSALTKAKAS
jgi:hypothetical protein